MNDEVKRTRVPNWQPSEKNLLADLVEKRVNIIECKKIDDISMKKKISEWKMLSVEFNSESALTYRSWESLKSQWESMKKTAKKFEARIRQNGGGSFETVVEDPLHTKVMGLIRNTAISLHNPFDSDANLFQESKGNSSENANISTGFAPMEISPEDICGLEHLENDSSMCNQSSKGWGDYASPSLRKNKISPKLLHLRKHRIDLLNALNNKRIEAINKNIELASIDAENLLEARKVWMELKKEELKGEKLKNMLLLLELKSKKKEVKN